MNSVPIDLSPSKTLEGRMDRAWLTDERLTESEPWRPLLVGPAPSRSSGGWPAFFGGASGRRLAELSGYGTAWWGLVRATERVNLLDEWPGERGRGDAFDLAGGREAAIELLAQLSSESRLEGGRRIILVGRPVAEAFGFIETTTREARRVVPPYQWLSCRRGDKYPLEITDDATRLGPVFCVAMVPHPSARNRYWDDPANMAAASTFLREAINVA